jgi:hypothetical protein
MVLAKFQYFRRRGGLPPGFKRILTFIRSLWGVDSIYYRVDGDTVEIMSIFGQQDVDEWILCTNNSVRNPDRSTTFEASSFTEKIADSCRRVQTGALFFLAAGRFKLRHPKDDQFAPGDASPNS